MVRVRLKVLAQEAVDFLCSLIFHVLGQHVEDCNRKLEANGYIEIQVRQTEFEVLREKIKKYSFIAMEVLQEQGSQATALETVPVKVALKGKTSPNFACNIISGILGYRVEGCAEALTYKGEITLELPLELAEKLLSSSRAYPFLQVEPLKDVSLRRAGLNTDSHAFSKSWELMKNNVGFFVAFALIYIVLILLSSIPLLGLILGVFLVLMLYTTLLYISVSYLRGQGERLSLLRIFDYMAPSAGLYLGSIALSFVGAFFSLLLLFVFGGIGMFSDIVLHAGDLSTENIPTDLNNEDMPIGGLYDENTATGTLASIGVYFILMLLVIMYYFYTFPLIYSRVIARGLDFGQGFLAVFYPFTPSGIKEAFSNAYLKKAGLWLVVITVVLFLAVMAIATVIFIPAGITLLLWLMTYTAILVSEYVSENYKVSL